MDAYLRVHNETGILLKSFWDGLEYRVEAGGNKIFPWDIAQKFVRDHNRTNRETGEPQEWVRVENVQTVHLGETEQLPKWEEDGKAFASQAEWMDYIRARALETARAATEQERLDKSASAPLVGGSRAFPAPPTLAGVGAGTE